MAVLRLKYVNAFKDRHGQTRYYFRHKGKRWPLPDEPGTTAFTARYDQLLAGEVRSRLPGGTIAFGPSTLGWVIEKWVGSPEFSHKAASTQSRYRLVLDIIRKRYGRGLLVDLRERHVRAIRSEFVSTSAADLSVTIISLLWSFAKERLARDLGNIDLGPNPAREIAKVHVKTFEHEPWPDEVIAGFLQHARPHEAMRLALNLLLYTGQRLGDVAAMTWERYDGEGISVRQEKTDALLWIPCDARLQDALAKAPRRSDFILTTQMGDRYSTKSLSNAISTGVKAAGFKGFSAHGLRKNAGVALAEAGCSDHQIMAVLGHRSYTQAHGYTRRARQKVLAKEAVLKRQIAER